MKTKKHHKLKKLRKFNLQASAPSANSSVTVAPLSKLTSAKKAPHLEDEDSSPVIESEESRRFLALLEQAYHCAQSVALASAQLELAIAKSHATESGEVPDEFDQDKFLAMQKKLLELRLLKDFAEEFKLGAFVDRLMEIRMVALFGPQGKPGGGSPVPGSNFYGSDEDFLTHRIKQSLMAKKPPTTT